MLCLGVNHVRRRLHSCMQGSSQGHARMYDYVHYVKVTQKTASKPSSAILPSITCLAWLCSKTPGQSCMEPVKYPNSTNWWSRPIELSHGIGLKLPALPTVKKKNGLILSSPTLPTLLPPPRAPFSRPLPGVRTWRPPPQPAGITAPPPPALPAPPELLLPLWPRIAPEAGALPPVLSHPRPPCPMSGLASPSCLLLSEAALPPALHRSCDPSTGNDACCPILLPQQAASFCSPTGRLFSLLPHWR